MEVEQIEAVADPVEEFKRRRAGPSSMVGSPDWRTWGAAWARVFDALIDRGSATAADARKNTAALMASGGN